MDHHVALVAAREQQRGDGRHAAGKDEAFLCPVPDGEAVFEDFLIGAVEAAIDEAVGAAGALAGDAFEVALARRRAFEGESGGEEDRRLERAFRQLRIVAVAHHQRGRLELAPAEGGIGGLGAVGHAGILW